MSRVGETDYPHSGILYKDLKLNESLCQLYVDEMAQLGRDVILKQEEPGTISTDMG
jgi:hypothetical protein